MSFQVYGPLRRHAGDGAGLDGPAGGSGALRLCHEWRLKCFGDRHSHQHGGGHGRPPPPGIPFLAFNAKLRIQFGSVPNHDAFALGTGITFSSTAPGFNPLTEAVTLQIGAFAVTIPPGSFQKNHLGNVIFAGVINGVTLQAVIKRTGTLRYAFQVGAQHATLTGTQNAVYVTLIIGSNSGATSVTAAISRQKSGLLGVVRSGGTRGR